MPTRVTARQTHIADIAAREIRFTMRRAPRSPTSSALASWTLELFHIRPIVTSHPAMSPIDNSFPADERPWKEHPT